MIIINRLFAGTVLACSLTVPAFAEYPERPISMVIPYSAGGATDISARSIGKPLGEAVGKPLVMTNIAGAGGVTGSVSVKNADSDGYTMLFTRVGTHSVSPAINAILPYALDDFRYLAVYEVNPIVCAVAPSSGIKSMDELIAKVNEGGVAYSTSGVGTLLNLAAVMVLKEFGVENPLKAATQIPQKGGGDAAIAVLNGTATFICTNSSDLANFVANGLMVPLLVTTPEPIAGFDAPSAASLGKPQLEMLVGWTGIAGPANLPDDVAEKWSGWVKTSSSDPEFISTMESLGSIIDFKGPNEAKEFIQKQYEVFRSLVEELNMGIEG